MTNRNTILQELKDLCPAVANLSRENLYAVPFGYFDNLANSILALINQKEHVLPITKHPFSVPEGYFNNLSFDILKKVKLQPVSTEALAELQEVAPLLKTISKQPCGFVPTGYFDTLPANILGKVQAQKRNKIEQELYEIAPLASTIRKQTDGTVPFAYFDNLPAKILSKIKQQQRSEVEQEIDEVAPLLNAISKQQVYTVPAGYFERLDLRPAVARPAKIISLFSGVNKMVKYAAAAVIAGVMVTGSFLLFDGQPSSRTNTQLEATAYKAESIKTLSNNEIIDYLKSNPSSLDATSSSGLDVDDKNLKSFLNEMSAEEIEQYLKENPDAGEVRAKEG